MDAGRFRFALAVRSRTDALELCARKTISEKTDQTRFVALVRGMGFEPTNP